jgi:hypothetical protein
VGHSAIALSGAQTNSSSIQGGLWLTKAAPVVQRLPRLLLAIFAVTESHGLIAKKSPPRWSRPSASRGHIARHGSLGDAEIEHRKLAMDPRRTPEKVLTGHLYDQVADFLGNPRASAAPATTCAIPPKR